MSELAIASDHPPARAPRGNTDIRVDGRSIGKKLRLAITFMVEDGLRFDEAATKAGITVRAMRYALERQHVLKHIRKRKEVFREAVASANIHHLERIRKQSNMPAVNAIAMLERLSDDQQQAQRSSAPGFQIAIVVQDGRAEHVRHQDAALIVQGNSIPCRGNGELPGEGNDDV